MARLGLGFRRERGLPGATPSASPAPAPSPAPGGPAGFFANGSANAGLKAMLARVGAGSGRGRILAIGDSTTAGMGSGTGTLFAGTVAKSYPSQLAALLTGAGWPAIATARMANGGVTPWSNFLSYDPRVAVSGSVYDALSVGTFDTLGGDAIYNQTGGAGTFALTVAETCDRFDVHFFQNTGNGSFSAQVDGGTPVAVNMNAAAAYGKVTLTCPRGAGHVVRLSATSSQLYLTAVIGYDSGAAQVEVVNAGFAGATASMVNNANPPFDALSAISVIAPDLTIVNLGINDWRPGTDQAAFRAQIGQIVGAARKVGDVLLTVPFPSQENGSYGSLPLSRQGQFAAIIREVGAGQGVAVLDLIAFFGGGTAPDGYYYDQLHPSAAGYAAHAGAVLQTMLAMAG